MHPNPPNVLASVPPSQHDTNLHHPYPSPHGNVPPQGSSSIDHLQVHHHDQYPYYASHMHPNLLTLVNSEHNDAYPSLHDPYVSPGATNRFSHYGSASYMHLNSYLPTSVNSEHDDRHPLHGALDEPPISHFQSPVMPVYVSYPFHDALGGPSGVQHPPRGSHPARDVSRSDGQRQEERRGSQE